MWHKGQGFRYGYRVQVPSNNRHLGDVSVNSIPFHPKCQLTMSFLGRFYLINPIRTQDDLRDAKVELGLRNVFLIESSEACCVMHIKLCHVHGFYKPSTVKRKMLCRMFHWAISSVPSKETSRTIIPSCRRPFAT